VLAPVTPWLVAAGACAALAVVVLGRPGIPPAAAGSSVALPAHARAVQVEHAFARMAPFSVQPHMGESNGKDANCSIYSDGDLDTGARVTWAVTLCTVHVVGKRTPNRLGG
jgi:hypothetical protein